MWYTIKRFWHRIKNIFRWIPISWKQYDFDYRYSIDVFKFQSHPTIKAPLSN